MASIRRIITLNKFANEALANKDIERAAKMLQKIHKVEVQDRVALGSYRYKDILF